MCNFHFKSCSLFHLLFQLLPGSLRVVFVTTKNMSELSILCWLCIWMKTTLDGRVIRLMPKDAFGTTLDGHVNIKNMLIGVYF